MKRIFAVIMALMLILSTTSQAYVVTVYGQNCTYTMTSPANRKITLSDKKGNVRWWKVEDTSNNIIGAIDGKFVTPSSDVEVTPMLNGNQIVVQQTANGTIKYNENVVNTVETTENQSYTLAITPNSGYEIATVKVDNVELEESEITANGMNYAFNNVTANHVITATFTEQQVAGIGIPNAPVIANGLTPVKWNGSTWVTTNINDSEWYNYEIASNEDGTEKEGVASGEIAKWANAQTDDGSMYVWIPRYTYRITEENGYHQTVDSWNADEGDNKTGKIEIKFSNGTADDTTDSYLSHPAFTFGDDELKGIWVAKYEASMEDGSGAHVETSSTTIGNVVLSDSVKLVSKPGVSAWRYITASNMFDNAYNLNRSLDSHLMKNVEWGAVAYLTNAIGRIPYINNSQDYITGNAGGSQDASSASGTTNAWNTVGGVKASTTHNVYGIYDLSGGAYEYVAAYVNNGHSNLTSYASSLVNSYSSNGTKYVDVYPVGTSDSQANNYAAWSNIKGDAVYETSSGRSGYTSWDGDCSNAPDSAYPVFSRGGSYYAASYAGVFCFYGNDGGGYSNGGFRPVLAIP